MKKLFLFTGILFCIGTSQASTKKKSKKDKIIRIIKQGKHEGKNVYKVILTTGERYEYMYMKEIRECKRTGIWRYNEDLILKK